MIAFSVLVLARKTVLMERKAEKNKLIQSYMVTLQGFYQTIQSQIDMTRRFRHDLARHIQTLEYLMEEKENVELQEYAEQLKQEYRKTIDSGETENEVVNVILTMKREQCQQKQIPFSVQVEEKGYTLVRDIDMVGILMNLLDNAIEENEKIEVAEQRGIWVEMKENEQKQIQIQVKNKIRSGKKIDFQTEKKKKEEHGIGRGIVEYLVKQYQGEEKVSVDQTLDIFCETVTLKSMRPEEESR